MISVSSKRYLSAAALLVVGIAFVHGTAAAEPFSFRRAIPLGRPAKTAALVVRERDSAVVVEVDKATAELPIEAPEQVEVQPLTLPGGAALAVVRVSGRAGRQAAALLSRGTNGRAEILWVGALDLRGDPGERTADGIETDAETLDERGATVRASVVVGKRSERARICGEAPALLSPRTVDEPSLKLKSVSLARLRQTSAPWTPLATSPESPGPGRPPLFRALRVSAVSSQLSAQAQPGWNDALLALVDGDIGTSWSTDNPGGSQGEFATFQWNGDGLPMRALALVPLPRGLPPERAYSVARVLWLVGDDGTRIELRLPDAPEAGRRYWIQFPKPIAAHCLSVVIARSEPLVANRPGPLVLAEVEAYTDVDFEGGLERLVSALGAANSGDAEHVLTEVGVAAVPKLRAAWPALNASGRRRAARILARSAETDAGAREALASGLDDSDKAVQAEAFAALLSAGPQARQALMARASQHSDRGDAVATALARQAPREALPALLAALALPNASERPLLREAVAVACQSAGIEALEVVRAWAQAQVDNLPARAALALALARAKTAEAFQPLAAELVAADSARAERFEDRWRLVQAARALPSDAGVDAWLADLAKAEERWMLRAASLDALADRNAAQRSTAAKAALNDEYSRVRASAAAALASDPSAREVLAVHAARDRWALVRIAALEALANQTGNEAALVAGVGDCSRQVRAAALRLLTKVRAHDAWPAVEQRLKDQNEWPQVLAEAIRFADELCERRAAPQLLEVLQRGIKPDAWAPDADNAQLAMDALLHFGGESAKAALDNANSPLAPAAFKSAAQRGAGKPGTCSAPTARAN